MITLTEFAKLIQNPLQKGIVSTFAQNSAVLEVLPFVPVSGNAYSFNVEKTLPNVSFRDYNENYSESTGTVQQSTETLKIFGGEGKVDRAMVLAQGNLNDLRALQDTMRSKAIAKLFEKTFFHGNSTTNSKEFDGLQKRLVGNQVIDGENTLTLALLDAAIDGVVGSPSAIFCNKSTRRKICDLVRASNQSIETVSDSFGRPLSAYASIPIRIVEEDSAGNQILDDEIYCVRFGAQEFCSGLQCGELQAYDLGLQSNFYTTSIEWLASIALFNGKSAVRLHNINAAEEPVTP